MPRFRNSMFKEIKKSIINSTKRKQHIQEEVRFEPTHNEEGRQSISSRKIGKEIEFQNNGDNELTTGYGIIYLSVLSSAINNVCCCEPGLLIAQNN